MKKSRVNSIVLISCYLSINRRRKAKYAIGSACIGGGQGIALLLEGIH